LDFTGSLLQAAWYQSTGFNEYPGHPSGGNACRTLSFRDLNGSVTGIPDSQVLLHDGEYGGQPVSD